MNTITLIDRWWCCVVPQHRALVVLLAAVAASLQAYVEKSAFDSAAQVYPGVSDEYRTGMLIAQLGLQPGVFIDPEGNQTEVYYFQPLTWLEYTAFLATPAATCTKRCKLLTFPA